jgi:2'-5' RNA ligase
MTTVSSDLPEQVRLFIAIVVPEEIKVELEKAQATLRKAVAQARVTWTRREQWHLTLRFLGNVSADRVPLLTEAAHRACHSYSPIQLRAERLGFFPNVRFPRVAWASVDDERNQLVYLQQAITEATQDFTSEEPEKEFTGHVTLARIKRIKRSEIKELAKVAEAMQRQFFGAWTASEVDIIKSELSSEGARYSTMDRVGLGA